MIYLIVVLIVGYKVGYKRCEKRWLWACEVAKWPGVMELREKKEMK